MIPVFTFNEFNIFPLTAKIAEKYVSEICDALNQIPLVDPHTSDQILATSKPERTFHAKWEHSLIALDQNKEFAGVLMSYEREAEGNEQYPDNSIYLSDFAIASKHQKKGLGKFMIQSWLKRSSEIGFTKLKGPLHFSIQTNNADWNQHVQKLYETFGFKKIATKIYGNREDNVYRLDAMI